MRPCLLAVYAAPAMEKYQRTNTYQKDARARWHTASKASEPSNRSNIDNAALLALLQPLSNRSATHYSRRSQIQGDDFVPHLPLLHGETSKVSKNASDSIFRRSHPLLTISATASNLSIRPAQFTTKSSSPNIFSPSEKTSSIFSSLVISACTTRVHSGYAAETFSLKSAMSSGLMSTTTTFAPARRNASEMARPRPPHPPVTSAVFWRKVGWLMVRIFSRCFGWLVVEVGY
jgi:hypothetical protein